MSTGRWRLRRLWPALGDVDNVGQVAPDGGHYWDGQRWVTTLSPDGKWRWNGQGWEAVKPPDLAVQTVRSGSFFRQIPGFRSGAAWKMVAALVGYAVIA